MERSFSNLNGVVSTPRFVLGRAPIPAMIAATLLGLFSGLLLAPGLSLEAAAEEPAFCVNPVQHCGNTLSSHCLQGVDRGRLGAGVLDAKTQGRVAQRGGPCLDEMDAYRDCLAKVATACQRVGVGANAGDCSNADARILWQSLQNSTNVAEIEAFGESCAGTAYAAVAAARARSLKAGGGSTDPGDATGDVRAAQRELRRLGLYRGSIDGDWGPGSQSAYRAFQRRLGVAETGALDESSLAALRAAKPLNGGASPLGASSTERPLSVSELRRMQVLLLRLGHYTGAISNIWGPAQRDALISWQRANHRRVDGAPSRVALNALVYALTPGLATADSSGVQAKDSGRPPDRYEVVLKCGPTSDTVGIVKRYFFTVVNGRGVSTEGRPGANGYYHYTLDVEEDGNFNLNGEYFWEELKKIRISSRSFRSTPFRGAGTRGPRRCSATLHPY